MNIYMKQGFGKGQVERPDIESRDKGIQKIQKQNIYRNRNRVQKYRQIELLEDWSEEGYQKYEYIEFNKYRRIIDGEC